MKKYRVKIKFTAPYLQARFSEQAKEELMKDAKKTVTKNLTEEDEMWLRFSYFDDNGYYVPSEQIKSCLAHSAKDFKMKAKRTSLYQWTKATLFVSGPKSYLNKKEPDELLTSYPKRKDGNRVKAIHPSFNVGTELEFDIECLDDDFSKITLKEIIENGGKRNGLGGRRPEFGRFELLKFEAIK